ncbi:hypothetical protein [Psychroflexus halocasei]|uniref:Uncharacterized protein n=1 Tax=Psychroflexus halocasei TaxID=908615 RepID=A0A1H4CAY8_9FLAO|nr:hypothetical protein [Psychroflexus halocasei]SEA57534.1 hypothetical protein SAMN05421540_107125 [Psychroflexus halocasei]
MKIVVRTGETSFFNLSVAKYVYVVKNGDKYEISISVIQGLENDTEALQPFVDLRTDMDNYFPNNKIEFKLVVDNLENVVKPCIINGWFSPTYENPRGFSICDLFAKLVA